jgi:hypothetical protein
VCPAAAGILCFSLSNELYHKEAGKGQQIRLTDAAVKDKKESKEMTAC